MWERSARSDNLTVEESFNREGIAVSMVVFLLLRAGGLGPFISGARRGEEHDLDTELGQIAAEPVLGNGENLTKRSKGERMHTATDSSKHLGPAVPRSEW